MRCGEKPGGQQYIDSDLFGSSLHLLLDRGHTGELILVSIVCFGGALGL
jgi:hypothetical protein